MAGVVTMEITCYNMGKTWEKRDSMEHNICPRCFCAITASGCACKQSTEVNAYDQLPVGTLLHNRYQVGGVRGGDAWSIEYYGLDTRENLRVTIREFFSHSFAYREKTQGPTVSPLNKDYDGFLNEFRTQTGVCADFGVRLALSVSRCEPPPLQYEKIKQYSK